jgi:zinc transporter 7
MSLRPSFLLPVVALLSLLLVGSYAAGQESTRVAEILSVFVSSLCRRRKRRSESGHFFRKKEDDIQQCEPVRKLSLLKETLEAEQSPILRTVFSWLFPFGPAWNSILGTFYISSCVFYALSLLYTTG